MILKEEKKDTNVELLRIIAILMVIGTHLKLPYVDSGKVFPLRTFVACLVGDGVAIFWIIMGFFYFKNSNYKIKIKKLILKIIIPLFICSFVYFYFYRFIAEGTSLRESISHTFDDYLDIIRIGILRWNNFVYQADHLWYLYIYAIVVLIYPLLNVIKDYINKFNPKKVIIIIFLLFLFNDLSLNYFFYFGHGFSGVLAALFYLFVGYLLYQNKDKVINNKKLGIIGLIIFILINLLRAIIVYKLAPTNDEPLYWFTSYAMISVIGIFLFVYGICNKINKSKIISKIINHMGSLTFYIYLIHIMVLEFLNNRVITNKLVGNDFLNQILYTIIVYLISLVISEFILFVKKIIKK